MQVSEGYRQELSAIYQAKVTESFDHARQCLRRARQARQDGDCRERRRWLRFARIFWQAGAGWSERAQTLMRVVL
jgi:hypothetical protein